MSAHNSVLLDEKQLREVLTFLSVRLFARFRQTVRLVIHGGAVMVLHRELACRTKTRDVDYCNRPFVAEWKKRGVPDAGERLSMCIAETAKAFRLGDDWMNSHPDVSLPMAYDAHGKLTDPIYDDALRSYNLKRNTVFESPGLVLVGVSWSWAVALKLVRYQKNDPSDIAAILKLGSQLEGCQWTLGLLENWLLNLCRPMGYSNYPPQEIAKTRAKMQDAVRRAKMLDWSQTPTSPLPQKPPNLVLPWHMQQPQPSHLQPAPAPQPPQPPRPTTVHEGMFAHERRQQERLAATRPRTRSFSSALPSGPVIPSAPVPPMPPMPMPIPMPTPPSSGSSRSPAYDPRGPRQRHPSMSAPAPPTMPVPVTMPAAPMYHHPPSRRSGASSVSAQAAPIVPARPPPRSAVPTPDLMSLPPGFVPTHFLPAHHYAHAAQHSAPARVLVG